MKRLKQSGFSTTRMCVVWACVATVLLVAGLQATHIHRDWLNPNHSGASGKLNGSTDTHCVLCLGSFAATVSPQIHAIESLVAQASPALTSAPVLYDHAAASDITIRPPPAL